MSGLSAEISQVENEIADLDRQMSAELTEIDAEAHVKRMSVITSSGARRGTLESRLLHLRAANGSFGPSPAPKTIPSEKAEPRTGRRPTNDVILSLLQHANDPVSASEIDAAVIAAGWTKAASEKAKTRLREAGSIVSEKRRYTITDKGREGIEGREHPS